MLRCRHKHKPTRWRSSLKIRKTLSPLTGPAPSRPHSEKTSVLKLLSGDYVWNINTEPWWCAVPLACKARSRRGGHMVVSARTLVQGSWLSDRFTVWSHCTCVCVSMRENPFGCVSASWYSGGHVTSGASDALLLLLLLTVPSWEHSGPWMI